MKGHLSEGGFYLRAGFVCGQGLFEGGIYLRAAFTGGNTVIYTSYFSIKL